MKERRQYHRFNIEMPAFFSTSASMENLMKATVLNISGTGIKMECKEKLELGQEITLKIELSPGEEIIVHAKIMWCNATTNMGEYRAGIKVNEKMEGDAERFVQFYAEKLKTYPRNLTD